MLRNSVTSTTAREEKGSFELSRCSLADCCLLFAQVAVQAGKVDKIRCLLKLSADAQATDLDGNTYFHLAARDGRTEVLEEAFTSDVDVTSANNDGDTALHLAAKNGHVDAVKLLLKKSKLNARNKYAALAWTLFNELRCSALSLPFWVYD